MPSTRRPEYGSPTEAARCHSTFRAPDARASSCSAGFRRRRPGAGTALRESRGGRGRAGTSGSGDPPAAGRRLARRRCAGQTAIGSIVADPRTSATAGTVRVASRRLRAACAASRRCREASSPVAIGIARDGSSALVATPAPPARAPRRASAAARETRARPCRTTPRRAASPWTDVLRQEGGVSSGRGCRPISHAVPLETRPATRVQLIRVRRSDT